MSDPVASIESGGRRRLTCPTCGAERVIKDPRRLIQHRLRVWGGILLCATVFGSVLGVPLLLRARRFRHLYCKSCGIRFILDQHGQCHVSGA